MWYSGGRSTGGDIIWEPGYLPPNGTSGMMFRAQWCDNCENDINEDCPIYTGALVAYPGPGPEEWEIRWLPFPKSFETRCTEFEPLEGTCGDSPERSP